MFSFLPGLGWWVGWAASLKRPVLSYLPFSFVSVSSACAFECQIFMVKKASKASVTENKNVRLSQKVLAGVQYYPGPACVCARFCLADASGDSHRAWGLRKLAKSENPWVVENRRAHAAGRLASFLARIPLCFSLLHHLLPLLPSVPVHRDLCVCVTLVCSISRVPPPRHPFPRAYVPSPTMRRLLRLIANKRAKCKTTKEN